MTDSPKNIKIIVAEDSELAGESAVRVEFYRRYWTVESWDPAKSRIHWAETIATIVKALGTTHGKVSTMLKKYPVRAEPAACPECGGPYWIGSRQTAQQVLRGKFPRCYDCMMAQLEELRSKRHEREKQFKVLERKTRKAFKAVICDDQHPEECVSSLDRSMVALYLDMLKRYIDKRKDPEYVGNDEMGKSIFVDPEVLLCGPWAAHLGDKYEKSGPDLYELARHRLIKPRRDLAHAIELTRDGLIDSSGYPYVFWEVAELVDGRPVRPMMEKQLGLHESETETGTTPDGILKNDR